MDSTVDWRLNQITIKSINSVIQKDHHNNSSVWDMGKTEQIPINVLDVQPH